MQSIGFIKDISHQRIYYWLLVFTVVSLPTSKGMMSIVPFLLLLNWIVEGGLKSKLSKFYSDSAIWLPISVFVIYLLGLLWSDSLKWGLHDIKIQIPLLIFPLVIGTSSKLGKHKLNKLLQFFIAAVVFASFCSFYVWLGFANIQVNDNRDISLFISHIRFSLLINIAIFYSYYFFRNNSQGKRLKLMYLISIVWLIFFLFVLKSFTGIVVFFLISSILILIKAFKVKHVVVRFALFVFVMMIPVFIGAYITRCINEFYNIEQVSDKQLLETTSLGNKYIHQTEELQLENGQYVFLFIAEDELKEAWNKRSELDYESNTSSGFNKYVLYRYLTSKGFRKDAEGLSKLSDQDIQNIENGIPNYLFADKLSVYSRIYQIIWEFDMYKKGGRPGGSSIVQRVEYFKIARQLIGEDFWFGKGTGGYFPAYQRKYDEHPFFNEQKYRQRSHNMFLSYWVDFGLIGMLFICFAFTYPIFKTKSNKDFLMLVFALVVLISCLNEDTLNNHDAITFFAFLYSLLVYRKIENRNEAII